MVTDSDSDSSGKKKENPEIPGDKNKKMDNLNLLAEDESQPDELQESSSALNPKVLHTLKN